MTEYHVITVSGPPERMHRTILKTDSFSKAKAKENELRAQGREVYIQTVQK